MFATKDNMEVKFKDLSFWLKVAIAFALYDLVITIFVILGAIWLSF